MSIWIQSIVYVLSSINIPPAEVLQQSDTVSFFYDGGLWTYENPAFLQGTATGIGYGPFDDQKGFIGINFSIGGDWHNGWIEYDGENLEIVSWAYESEYDEPIHVSNPVPEPSSLGLLALGATGVAALRRRKKKKDQKREDVE